MKKSLFIIATLLCLAIFVLPAMATETECTHEYIRCTGVCEDCGATGLTSDNPYHNWANDFTITDAQCWTICADCNEQIGLMNHKTYCYMNGECVQCGTTEGTISVEHENLGAYEYDDYSHWRSCSSCGETETGSHSHTGVYQHDDSYCWEICPDCGMESSKFMHGDACNNPGVCERCGIAWDGGAPHAPLVDTLTYDENYCWYLCANCGEVVEKSAHFIICSYPGVCNRCGAAASDSASVIHSYDYETRKYDETYCWNECTGCGDQNNKWEHTVSCSNPGVCVDCGAASSAEVYHIMYGTDPWYSEGDYHWQLCNECGEKVNYGTHSLLCDGSTNGLCYSCGIACTDDNPMHVGRFESAYDAENHFLACPSCDLQINVQKHSTACNSDGTCDSCDYEGQIDNVVHNDWHYEGDETQHFEACYDCNTFWNYANHVTACDAPETCTVCGAACSVEPTVHNFDYDNRKYDDTNCWFECTGCGEKEDVMVHRVECTKPGVCYYCDMPYDSEPEHFTFGERVYEYDAEAHWTCCDGCGIEIARGSHDTFCDNPGVCVECGATGCTNAPQHVGSFEIEYDETRHWEVCSTCGEVAWEGGEHFNVCISGLPLGRCVECDYDQTTIFYHTYDGGSIGEEPQTTWNHNETECWKECIGCNAELADTRFPHHTSCDNPGVCTACGTEVGDDIEVMHYRYADTPYEYDETHHWFICVMCNEQAMKGEHKFNESERDESKVVYTCGCGATKEEQLHVEHVWIESARVEATCGVKGKIVYICECGETKTEEIPALEHRYTTAETPATCEAEGKKVTTCANCGDETTEVIPATGHSYTVVETPATCEAEGKKVTTCANCGDETTEVIPATGHSYTVVETPATCEVEGKKVTTCANCGDETTEVIPALSHSYDVTSLRQSTCVEQGIKEVTCKHCGDEIVTYQPATGHNYIVTETPAACEVDGEKVTECANCGDKTVEVISAVGHNYAVKSETAADCETDGEKVSACTVCGHETVETTPAVGHAYSLYAAKGNGTHVAECKTCGATRVRSCEYQDVTTSGITLTVCSVCGHTRYALLSVVAVQEETTAEQTEQTAETTQPEQTADVAQSDEPAEEVTPDTLFVPTKVERAVATTKQGEALQSGVQLVVYDQTAMLQEDSPILAMYTLGLESDGYAVKPEQALRVELPLTEEQTAEDFAQYKLVIIAADGTMTEIEYVIEEGKIIFETELVGILAFLPIEE